MPNHQLTKEKALELAPLYRELASYRKEASSLGTSGLNASELPGMQQVLDVLINDTIQRIAATSNTAPGLLDQASNLLTSGLNAIRS